MRVRAAASVLIVSAVIAGRAQAPQDPADPARSSASVAGRVLGADDSPVRHARVLLIPSDGLPLSATTDADGRFVFGQAAEGRYTVEAGKAGYLTGRFGATQPIGPPATIPLVNGSRVAAVDIHLVKSAAL